MTNGPTAVDVAELAFALRDATPERDYFLDVETGDLIPVGDEFGAEEANQERRAMTAAPARFRRVPHRSAASDDADRRAFIE